MWQAGDAALVAELGGLETQLHVTWAQMLEVIAEISSRDMTGLGYKTTTDLVRAVARVPLGEARARIAAATDVLPGRGLNGAPIEPKLPATAAAVAEHAIGAADVRVIRSILRRIPAHLDAQTRADVETQLAHHARTLDAGQLDQLGKRILSYLDQDGARPNDTPETRRHLSFRDRDGGCALAGRLDREAAEILRSALSPLAAPRPATDTEIDLRTASQRDADALVDLAQRALGSGDLPTEGGERPQVVVTVSLAVLQGRIGTATLALGGPINADIARRIACDARIIPAVLGARVSHWILGAPAIRYRPRSAAQSLSGTADAPSRAVLYQPAGPKFIILSIGLIMVLLASTTASRSAVATTDSSTIPPGE
ncbi:MAG: DUF222 domain-containing protein [Pseudonocardiaceae bacterium]